MSDYEDGVIAFERDVLPADGKPDNPEWMKGWLDASSKEEFDRDTSIGLKLRLRHGKLALLTDDGRWVDVEGLSVEQSGGNIFAHATIRVSEIEGIADTKRE